MDNPFERMMEGPSGNPFRELMSKLFQSGNEEDKYEPIAPLSKKDNKEWDMLNQEFEKAKSRILEIEARRKIFWIRLERKLKMHDRGLKIESGMVMGEVSSKNNCHTPGERAGIPGFCDGDCANCSQEPDGNEDSDE